MSMTLLQIVQSACKRTGLPTPASVIGNSDQNIVQMLAFLEQAGKEIRDDHKWPEMNKEYTFDLVASQANYALPVDFDYVLFETMWDRDNFWPLIGPLNAQQWQERKSGVVASPPRSLYRVKGWQTNCFYIDPTPTSGEAGWTLVLEYQSNNWIRPTTAWTAGATISGAGQYRYYGDNVYVSTGAGTTGATPPTHVTGSVSDGAVTWTAALYDTFAADTDVVLLPDELAIEGARWRFKREKGLPYEQIKDMTESEATKMISDKKSAQTLNIRGNKIGTRLVTPACVPDTGYNNYL